MSDILLDLEEYTSVVEAAERQVPVAAAVLDDVRPDWFREVNLDELVVDSLDRCVLGQLYGTFATGYSRVVEPRRSSHCYLTWAFSSVATEADWRHEVVVRRARTDAAVLA